MTIVSVGCGAHTPFWLTSVSTSIEVMQAFTDEASEDETADSLCDAVPEFKSRRVH
jgi:hypothetical protein